MPNSRQLHIAPNVPVFVSLVDPNGEYDMDLRQGVYQTTSGDLLILPRSAVIALNLCEPRPGEEIVIQKHLSGKPGDSPEWTVALSTRSELSRATSEATDSQDLSEQLQRSIEALKPKESVVGSPTVIRKPAKRDIPEQPRLFDKTRGTGTDGPAPQAAVIPVPVPAVPKSRRPTVGQIPANVAVREILQFIAVDPNTKNWDAQSRQDLASTVIIAAYRAGHVGLWERGE